MILHLHPVLIEQVTIMANHSGQECVFFGYVARIFRFRKERPDQADFTGFVKNNQAAPNLLFGAVTQSIDLFQSPALGFQLRC